MPSLSRDQKGNIHTHFLLVTIVKGKALSPILLGFPINKRVFHSGSGGRGRGRKPHVYDSWTEIGRNQSLDKYAGNQELYICISKQEAEGLRYPGLAAVGIERKKGILDVA